ncbi:threonylcarbamoyl-AMP synthase [Aliifodinibius salipaludis]|uniref:Threonylcarbamoyl-AMP synthase n=1 Tax=Fodinibius salipaludis TaxID=2032627 RepID=A0A2A2G5J3_9BACT|nr:L-threonylcarbamoyladenylate synthase [Aliifodinibius salipaludis]PAU92911.1 threonylcarbamoyl-AMP synthase [Aliifodinibius salipaludis]
MLDRYVDLLKSGEVVAFPTETVYGLGANAKNPDAIKKVFEIKGRPSDNPLIVHISNQRQVKYFASEISDDAQNLMDSFWPGPLTLIFKKKPEVLDIITAGLDTVALRWPKHPLSQQLIRRAGPLVAPSANSSGKPSPTKAEHVKEDFGEDFPVVDAGKTEIGLESTVLDISCEPYTIYRPGAVSAHEITEIIGREVVQDSGSSKNDTAKSPGTKYSHYSPQAKVQWISSGDTTFVEEALYLLHSRPAPRKDRRVIHYEGDFKKMAHELFDRFRQTDHQQLEFVFIEPFANEQLQNPIVQALQNRISKAIG